MCSKIAGTNLEELLLYRVGATKKAQSVLADRSHSWFSEYKLLPSGRRYILPGFRTNRLKNSLAFRTVLCNLFECRFVCVGDCIYLLLAVQQIAPWG